MPKHIVGSVIRASARTHLPESKKTAIRNPLLGVMGGRGVEKEAVRNPIAREKRCVLSVILFV